MQYSHVPMAGRPASRFLALFNLGVLVFLAAIIFRSRRSGQAARATDPKIKRATHALQQSLKDKPIVINIAALEDDRVEELRPITEWPVPQFSAHHHHH